MPKPRPKKELLYVVRKYVHVKNIKDALKKEKDIAPHEVFISTEDILLEK